MLLILSLKPGPAFVVLLFFSVLGLQAQIHTGLTSTDGVGFSNDVANIASLADRPVSLLDHSPFSIDYYAFERLLWQFNSSADGGLLIEPHMVKRLDRISGLLPGDLTRHQSEHLHRLIARSVPGEKGKRLNLLIESYRTYQTHYQNTYQALSGLNETEKYIALQELDQNLESRQRDFFGDDADVIFAQQNLTTHYINQRLLLNLDPEITNLERQRQLSNLQQAYLEARAEFTSQAANAPPRLP